MTCDTVTMTCDAATIACDTVTIACDGVTMGCNAVAKAKKGWQNGQNVPTWHCFPACELQLECEQCLNGD